MLDEAAKLASETGAVIWLKAIEANRESLAAGDPLTRPLALV